jgi:membrane protein required for colicin V production
VTLAVTTPDAIVMALVGLFALRGAYKGFVWQLIRTAGLLAGLVLGARFDVVVGRFLAERFGFVPRAGSDMTGWVVVVLGTFLAVSLVAHVARGAVHDARLAGPDRLLGLVLGGLLGLGLSAFACTLWASVRTRAEVRESLQGSVSVEWMARFVSSVKPLFPDGVRKRWDPVLESLAK